jgi:ornithine decarboxylase
MTMRLQSRPGNAGLALSGADREDVGSSGRIDEFLVRRSVPTPFIVIDLNAVRARWAAFHAHFPRARILYAVKANPAVEVIGALAALGADFDLASEGEINRCRALGIDARRLTFGNAIKREAEIVRAYEAGINFFAFDSSDELDKLARAAPGTRVFCRMLVHTGRAQWPLTRKFGCSHEMAVDLLQRARVLGLRPVGLSFHVGSQQIDPTQWSGAIAAVARIFQACARTGVELESLNVGGGFPSQYRDPIPPMEAYAEAVNHALARHFGNSVPHIAVEPGRYIVGETGILRTEVLVVARKSRKAGERWVYLDAGRYNGLAETQGERIRYRLRTPDDGTPCGPVIIAGPTCDSSDIIYEHNRYELPLTLARGDFVDFLSAGAYTASYASVEFNGFEPVKTYFV